MSDKKNEPGVPVEAANDGTIGAHNGHKLNGGKARTDGHKKNGAQASGANGRQTTIIPMVDAVTHSNGNGAALDGATDDTPSVRPVKARVGGGNTGRLTTGVLAAPVTLTGRLEGDQNGNGQKARLGAPTANIAGQVQPTAPLRESDLAGLRLRLKTREWPIMPTDAGSHFGRGKRTRSGKKQIPPFMMRHRQMRSRSRIGYVRAQAATRRYGSSGATGVLARALVVLFILGFLVTSATVGAGIGGAGYYISTLPPVDPEHLAQAIQTNGIIAQSTKIYDRNGIPLYDFVDEETGLHESLNLNEMSPLVISATIAAEDSSFYSNPGIDPYAILRAVRINLSGDGSSGASTVTQQLARNIFMSLEERTDPSFTRKIKEAALAVALTRVYSKDYIMELYLNQTYYGHRAYGIGAASRTYFGKKASDINLAEAALLAGLAQAPDAYDPTKNYDGARERQVYTLEQMEKYGMITEAQKQEALNYTVVLTREEPQIKAPHFVYYVKDYLEQKYGPAIANAGLIVTTTLDMRAQDLAQQVASDRIGDLRSQKATNAAIVVMKPNTGEILAMLGSVDYNDTSIDGQVNVATRERQPGSSFKPITYLTAFEKGWTPGTTILDTLTAFNNPGQKDYVPGNYDGKDHGWVTVREALANSFNIPAVKALQFAGVDATIQTAHDLGIKGLNRGSGWYGLSMTLGGGEVTLLDMTNAYSTFANYGNEVDANPILQIADSQGRIIYHLDPKPPANQVADPRLTYMITSILSDNKARTPAFGANSPLKVSFPAAVKTGTTDDNRDSWTMGYTPNLTVGVWVGNDDNSQMLKVTGAIGAAFVWHNFMEGFYKDPQLIDLVRKTDGSYQKDFVEPGGLIRQYACSAAGGNTDLFLKEAPPTGCVTYKDTNKQLHQVPDNTAPRTTKPTPIPGIVYPTPSR